MGVAGSSDARDETDVLLESKSNSAGGFSLCFFEADRASFRRDGDGDNTLSILTRPRNRFVFSFNATSNALCLEPYAEASTDVEKSSSSSTSVPTVEGPAEV
jgi:hypothetical protein